MERLRPQLFTEFCPDFACSSEMRSVRRLLFVRQTGSRNPVLGVSEFQYWQFLGCLSTSRHEIPYRAKIKQRYLMFSGDKKNRKGDRVQRGALTWLHMRRNVNVVYHIVTSVTPFGWSRRPVRFAGKHVHWQAKLLHRGSCHLERTST